MSANKEFFEMELKYIQPSQLYISEKKLAKVKKTFNPKDISTLGKIPIKQINNTIFNTDGHTRALAAYQAGFNKVSVIWECDKLDWEMYKICIKWCRGAGIYTIADLDNRIVKQKDYKNLWYKRCDDLNKKLALERAQNNYKRF